MKYNKLAVADHLLTEAIEAMDQLPEALSAGIEASLHDCDERSSIAINVFGSVAVVSASGVLMPTDRVLPEFFGIVGFKALTNAARLAASQEGVEHVILDIDSPGGTVTGSIEASEELATLATETHLLTHTSDMALSAGFMLAAATGEVHLSQTASLGSIGVRATHVSFEKMNEMDGVEITELFVGRKKIDGSPNRSLSAEARRDIMADLEVSFDMFADVVENGLGLSRQAIVATEAGIFMGQSAIKAELATSIITLEDLISSLNVSEDNSIEINGTESNNTMSISENQNPNEANGENMTLETTASSPGNDQSGNPIEPATTEAAGSAETVADEFGADYLTQVMDKLQTLNRLDAMPEIVKEKIAVEDISDKLAYASNVTAFCKAAGHESDAEIFLEAKTPIADIKSALFDKMVAEATATSVETHAANPSQEQAKPEVSTPDQIYANRRTVMKVQK